MSGPAAGDISVLDEVAMQYVKQKVRSVIEIGNAMLVIAEQSGGVEAEELEREAHGAQMHEAVAIPLRCSGKVDEFIADLRQ